MIVFNCSICPSFMDDDHNYYEHMKSITERSFFYIEKYYNGIDVNKNNNIVVVVGIWNIQNKHTIKTIIIW